MNTYLLVLENRSESAVERAESAYTEQDTYQINDMAILIRTKDSPLDVAHSCGIRGENRVEGASGVVYRIPRGWAGYADKELWKWMRGKDA